MRAGTKRSAGIAVLVLATASAAAAAQTRGLALPKRCPSASEVSAALGQKAKTPLVSRSSYVLGCKYGSDPLAAKVEFQVDTATTFAAGEKAAAAALPVAKVQHLGKAAWAPKSAGSLYVFTGSYTIKILAPLTSLTKLEALARKLL